MPEYHHEDKKEYLIAEGEWWRVWNNGIVESLFREKWEENSHQTWEQRLEFLKCWEKAKIGKMYTFNWISERKIFERGNCVKFLGFKEQCPECKQFNLIWEGKIQLCEGCEYIHAFEYDDS